MPIDHFPERIRPGAYRLRGFLMTDASALLILAAGCLAGGVGYLQGDQVPMLATTHPAERLMLPQTWGVIWLGVGLLCILAAWSRSLPVEMAALATGVGIHILWGSSYFAQCIMGGDPHAWISAISFWMVASLVAWAVWRGKRGDVSFPKEGGPREP